MSTSATTIPLAPGTRATSTTNRREDIKQGAASIIQREGPTAPRQVERGEFPATARGGPAQGRFQCIHHPSLGALKRMRVCTNATPARHQVTRETEDFASLRTALAASSAFAWGMFSWLGASPSGRPMLRRSLPRRGRAAEFAACGAGWARWHTAACRARSKKTRENWLRCSNIDPAAPVMRSPSHAPIPPPPSPDGDTHPHA